MGRVRVCGKICHEAEGPTCGCWCGGTFHGARGKAARDAFREVFGDDPKGQPPEDADPIDVVAFERACRAGAAARVHGPPPPSGIRTYTKASRAPAPRPPAKTAPADERTLPLPFERKS